jgi:hypothetical protein
MKKRTPPTLRSTDSTLPMAKRYLKGNLPFWWRRMKMMITAKTGGAEFE